MKRSSKVVLGSLAVVAAGLCTWGIVRDDDPDYSRACIDPATHIRYDDEECDDDDHRHVWFYSSYVHPVPAVGSPVDPAKGSVAQPSGTISSVARGGFGGHGNSGFGG